MNTRWFLAILCAALLAGCEKKLEPVQVGEMSDYRDPGFGFKIKYPKEWKNLGQTGKAVFAPSQEVLNKFLDPSAGAEGAQVTVEVVRFEGKTGDDIVKTFKDDMAQMQAQLSPDQPGTYGGKQGVMIPYRIQATTKTSIFGHAVFVMGDTAVYELDFKGYGDHYAANVPVFEAVLKSFEPPVVVARSADTWAASSNLETFTSPFFTIQYPDNLEFVQIPKGTKDFVMEMRADRRDCSIHIDVFGAKGLTVEKVWDQNKATYKARGTGETQIDGQKTYWVDYAPPVPQVMSRAYFAVKNDKVIRTTVNYFVPQKALYLPVFEAMVKSIKLK